MWASAGAEGEGGARHRRVAVDEAATSILATKSSGSSFEMATDVGNARIEAKEISERNLLLVPALASAKTHAILICSAFFAWWRPSLTSPRRCCSSFPPTSGLAAKPLLACSLVWLVSLRHVFWLIRPEMPGQECQAHAAEVGGFARQLRWAGALGGTTESRSRTAARRPPGVRSSRLSSRRPMSRTLETRCGQHRHQACHASMESYLKNRS